jgi:hypothetical protein
MGWSALQTATTADRERGRDEVAVVSTEAFRRLKGEPSGKARVASMRSSSLRKIDIEPRSAPPGPRPEPLTGWLLDTNVLSELGRPRPEPKVVGFVSAQPLEQLYVSTVTFAEIGYDIEHR